METPLPEGVSQIDQEVFAAHNAVRTTPLSFVADLEALVPRFDGNLLKNDETHVHIRTNEGVAAVNECINFLKEAQPLQPLVWNQLMAQAAADHTLDTGTKGMTGHDGSDGSTLANRLEKYGKPVSTYGENLSYGQSTGREVVIQLLIDDGVASRGHRLNIFNQAFKTIGTSAGTHKQYENMVTIDYAGGFTPIGEEDPMQVQMNAFMKEEVKFETPEGATGWS